MYAELFFCVNIREPLKKPEVPAMQGGIAKMNNAKRLILQQDENHSFIVACSTKLRKRLCSISLANLCYNLMRVAL